MEEPWDDSDEGEYEHNSSFSLIQSLKYSPIICRFGSGSSPLSSCDWLSLARWGGGVIKPAKQI